jgi:peptidoglycan hydrolase-like protein with peptidoglycan-binding domain
LVFQEAGAPYGCEDDQAQPSKADAYTGSWKKDVERIGIRVSVEQAAATVGGIVLRYPPGPGKMGHIALCDGKGGTVEAKGQRYGVVADTVHGREWDTGVLIPGITYDSAPPIKVTPPAVGYALNAPNMNTAIVANIQEALHARGFDSGLVDGEFGFNTQAAVLAFQQAEGLVVDGAVGPETAAALNVSLTNASAPKPDEGGGKMTAINNVASVIQQILGLLQSIQTQQTTAPQTSTGGTPQQVSTDDIKKALDAIAALLGKSNELGQVNGALGQTIGDLLNGKKTAIGVIGSLITYLFAPGAGGASILSGLIGTALPGLAAFSGPAFPIFLAIAAWGILGKFEKWSQNGTPPTK